MINQIFKLGCSNYIGAWLIDHTVSKIPISITIVSHPLLYLLNIDAKPGFYMEVG